jgi:hypothetical protein
LVISCTIDITSIRRTSAEIICRRAIIVIIRSNRSNWEYSKHYKKRK